MRFPTYYIPSKILNCEPFVTSLSIQMLSYHAIIGGIVVCEEDESKFFVDLSPQGANNPVAI